MENERAFWKSEALQLKISLLEEEPDKTNVVPESEQEPLLNKSQKS
jgi:hypothetical protein